MGASNVTLPASGGAVEAALAPDGTSSRQVVSIGGVGPSTASVALLTGAGATGTGSPRVTVAQDTTTIGGAAPGTAGTPSTSVVSVQGVSGGTPTPISGPTCGRVEVTPTIQNASYVSGNCIGGLVSFTLPRTASGLLQDFEIQFIGGATTGLVCYFFYANPSGSTFTDKGTFSIAAADESKRINKLGIILTPSAVTGDTVTGAAYLNAAMPFPSEATIYAAFCVTGTFTPATTTDLRLSIGLIQEAT